MLYVEMLSMLRLKVRLTDLSLETCTRISVRISPLFETVSKIEVSKSW